MYKFGFFFRLPHDNLYQELVLGFDGKIFRFYFINYDLIPYRHTHPYIREHCCELNLPVLYRGQGNKITDIIFFDDLYIDGLTRGNASKNQQIKIKIGETLESNDLMIEDSKSIFRNNLLTEKESEFGKLALEAFISNQYIDKLQTDATYISASDYYNFSSSRGKYRTVIKQFKDYIDSIDLEKILSSLWVNVWDYHKTKVGGDDSYYVYREAKLLDGTIITDPYLKSIIGLGEVEIQSESAYTSHFQRPNIPFGIYENEILEAEKRKIIEQYSKEEHMGWLFYNQLYKQEKLHKDITDWERRRDAAINNLKNHFYYTELNSLEQKFFYNLSKYNTTTKNDDALKHINRLIYHIQENTPKTYVIISGKAPSEEESIHTIISEDLAKILQEKNKIKKKIQEIINFLSTDKRLVIISGKANYAEQTAYHIATENAIETMYIHNYPYTKNAERAKDMIAESQLLILTECKSNLSKNLLLEAKAKGIPVYSYENYKTTE